MNAEHDREADRVWREFQADYRLTAEDEQRIAQRLTESVREGWRDRATLERLACSSIGCATYDLRDCELDYIGERITEMLGAK